MRILYIFSEDDKYGSPRSSFEQILSLKEKYKNYEPVILTPKINKINELCEQNNIENYTVKYRSSLFRYSTNLKTLIHLMLLKLSYDSLETFSAHKIAREINMNTIDAIYSTNSSILIGIKLSKKYHKPHIMHLREILFEQPKTIILKRNVIKRIEKNTDHFFAVSNYVNNAWKKRVPTKKIITLYDRININDQYERKLINKNKMVLVGSFTSNKNQLEALKAIKILKQRGINNISLDLYGNTNTPYCMKLKKYTSKNHLKDNIHFKEYTENIRNLLKEYRIGLMCSYAEGFGRTTVEYMSAKLAVIASNQGANLELVKHKQNGLLYNIEDPNSLADSIQYLLDNPQETEELANEALKTAQFLYKTSSNNDKTVYTTIKECIKQRK